MSEREEVARRVAERLGIGETIEAKHTIPIWEALLSAEQRVEELTRELEDLKLRTDEWMREAEQRVGELTAELAKCGRENCFGQEVEGCRRWVSEESLLKSKARVEELQEALRLVEKVIEGPTLLAQVRAVLDSH